MSENELLAPRHPPVGRMDVKDAFETKTTTEQIYAHHLSRFVREHEEDSHRS